LEKEKVLHLLVRYNKFMKKVFIVVIFLLSFAYASGSELQIYFLDVGQGDATCIIGENGKTLLIDAGNNGKGDSVIVPFLDSVGITHLDYIIATHYHADHIGGIDEVIYSGIEVDTVYDRGSSYTTQTYFDYIDAIGTRRNTITEGKIINLGDSCYIQCVVVNGKLCNVDSVYVSNDENAHSIGLLIEYNDFDFFISGDLTGGGLGTPDVESAIAPIIGDIEVYQINHHGSATSTNQIFIDTLRPEIAIISTGNNSYGHPTQVVLDRLQSCEETQMIYQTESGNGGWTPKCNIVNGHISVFTDGSTYFTVNGSTYYLDEVHCDEPILISDGYLFNSPNPFNPSTTISFSLARDVKNAKIEIYNIKGQKIKTLECNNHVIAKSTQSIYSITWDGTDENNKPAPSGIYFYQLRLHPDLSGVGDRFDQTRKMILIR